METTLAMPCKSMKKGFHQIDACYASIYKHRQSHWGIWE